MMQTTTPKQLRTFGCMMAGVWVVMALWPLAVHGRPIRWWALMLGAGWLILALAMPRLLASLYRAWMTLGGWMSWFNTRLILALGFFGLVTPMAVVRRMCGRDSMRRRFNAEASSYRLVRTARPGSHLYHQY